MTSFRDVHHLVREADAELLAISGDHIWAHRAFSKSLDGIPFPMLADWGMAVIGAPAYFAARGVPRTPHDLTGHNCINLRLMSYGGHYAWEFEKDGTKLNVRVDGQLAFNSSLPMLTAALAGHGLTCIPEDMAAPYIAAGQLKRVLKDWMPRFVGYHLYYPSRRQASPAFELLVEALRYRPRGRSLHVTPAKP